jgi:hypothetical protein
MITKNDHKKSSQKIITKNNTKKTKKKYPPVFKSTFPLNCGKSTTNKLQTTICTVLKTPSPLELKYGAENGDQK